MSGILFIAVAILAAESAYLISYPIANFLVLQFSILYELLFRRALSRFLHSFLSGFMSGLGGTFCAISISSFILTKTEIVNSWSFLIGLILPIIGEFQDFLRRFRLTQPDEFRRGGFLGRLHAAIKNPIQKSAFQWATERLDRTSKINLYMISNLLDDEDADEEKLVYTFVKWYTKNMSRANILGTIVGVFLALHYSHPELLHNSSVLIFLQFSFGFLIGNYINPQMILPIVYYFPKAFFLFVKGEIRFIAVLNFLKVPALWLITSFLFGFLLGFVPDLSFLNTFAPTSAVEYGLIVSLVIVIYSSFVTSKGRNGLKKYFESVTNTDRINPMSVK